MLYSFTRVDERPEIDRKILTPTGVAGGVSFKSNQLHRGLVGFGGSSASQPISGEVISFAYDKRPGEEDRWGGGGLLPVTPPSETPTQNNEVVASVGVVWVNGWLIATRLPERPRVRPYIRPAHTAVVSELMTGAIAASRATIAADGATPTAPAPPPPPRGQRRPYGVPICDYFILASWAGK